MTDTPVLACEHKDAWTKWLEENHATSRGVWLRLAKKAAGAESVSYSDAIGAALCYGWIDGQKKADDEQYWLQKFTPRSVKSIWSKINREKALALIECGEMKAAGLREIERAKADGRWDAAYDSAGTSTIPEDFSDALNRNPAARAFFETLDRRNRYSILFRIQTAKKAQTRATRIAHFTAMLERREKLYP